jgi:hypothetical protein
MVGLLSIGVRSATGPAMEQQQARSMHTSIAHSVHIKQPNSRPGPQAPQAHVGPNDGRHHSAAAFKTRHEMKTGGGGEAGTVLCNNKLYCLRSEQCTGLTSFVSQLGHPKLHPKLQYRQAGRSFQAPLQTGWQKGCSSSVQMLEGLSKYLAHPFADRGGGALQNMFGVSNPQG